MNVVVCDDYSVLEAKLGDIVVCMCVVLMMENKNYEGAAVCSNLA